MIDNAAHLRNALFCFIFGQEEPHGLILDRFKLFIRIDIAESDDQHGREHIGIVDIDGKGVAAAHGQSGAVQAVGVDGILFAEAVDGQLKIVEDDGKIRDPEL